MSIDASIYQQCGIPIDVPQLLLKVKPEFYQSGALNTFGLLHDSCHFHCLSQIVNNHMDHAFLVEGITSASARQLLRSKLSYVSIEDGVIDIEPWGNRNEALPDIIYITDPDGFNGPDMVRRARSWKSVEFSINTNGQMALAAKRLKGYDICICMDLGVGDLIGDWDKLEFLTAEDITILKSILLKIRGPLSSKGEASIDLSDDIVPDIFGVLGMEPSTPLDPPTVAALEATPQRNPEPLDRTPFPSLWGNTNEEPYLHTPFPIQHEGTRHMVVFESIKVKTLVRCGWNRLTKGKERTRDTLLGCAKLMQEELENYQQTIDHNEWQLFKKAFSKYPSEIYWKGYKKRLREEDKRLEKEGKKTQKMPDKRAAKKGSTNIIDLSFSHLTEVFDTGIRLMPKTDDDGIEDPWVTRESIEAEKWINSTYAGHKIATFCQLSGILYKYASVYDKKDCKFYGREQVIVHKVGMGNRHYGFLVRSEAHIRSTDEDGNFDLFTVYFSKHILADTCNYFIWDVSVEYVDGSKDDHIYMYIGLQSCSGSKVSYWQCVQPRVAAVITDVEAFMYAIAKNPKWRHTFNDYKKGKTWPEVQERLRREKEDVKRELKVLNETRKKLGKIEMTMEEFEPTRRTMTEMSLDVSEDKPTFNFVLFHHWMRKALEAHLVLVFWKMFLGGRFSESSGLMASIVCRCAEARVKGWKVYLRNAQEFRDKLYDEVRDPLSQYLAEAAISCWKGESFTNDDWWDRAGQVPKANGHGEYDIDFEWILGEEALDDPFQKVQDLMQYPFEMNLEEEGYLDLDGIV